MTNLNLARCTFNAALPGALFFNAVNYLEFAPERHRYEAAVRAYAAEASPAALRQYVATMRHCGIRVTQADAREVAVCGLREALLALGYGEAEVRWHAARRGRRDRHLFLAAAGLGAAH